MDIPGNSETTQDTHCGCQCRNRRGVQHDAAATQPKLEADARPAAPALDILDARFARGEIEKIEYLEKSS
jgi:hypothetical protein